MEASYFVQQFEDVLRLDKYMVVILQHAPGNRPGVATFDFGPSGDGAVPSNTSNRLGAPKPSAFGKAFLFATTARNGTRREFNV
jgi:hypothetical protein